MDREGLENATFALGCFWGPDARFGAIDGVVRTRVGYAGGEKPNPTYHSLGNHTETMQVDYDPEAVGYDQLLDVFWESHDPTRRKKTQYKSIIFYHDDEQRELAEESRDERETAYRRSIKTEIRQLDAFYTAEDYHQKHSLRNSSLVNEFEDYSPEEFRESPVAAKLNAYVAGHDVDLDELDADVDMDLGILEDAKRRLRKTLSGSETTSNDG